MTPELTVYVRQGCHLCADMLQVLEELRPELGFSYHTRDVDDDAALAARFGARVPVRFLIEKYLPPA